MPERGEDVLCYHCNNVFPKDEFGLMCPRCGSDFTEIIEGSAEEQHQIGDHNSHPSSTPLAPSLSPHEHQPQSPQSLRSARYDAENPFFNHNPWSETNDDEPQRFGSPPRVSRHSYRSPDGRITFTSTTFTTGMGGRHRIPPSPDMYGGEPLLRTFGTIFQELAGAYNTQNRNGPPPDREEPWETPGASRGANFHGGSSPRNTDSPQPPPLPLGSLNDIFDLLRTDAAGYGFDRPGGGIHIMGTTGMGPLHPLSLLATILGGGRIGDAVYSQEELDRVISQLVDQNMNQGAPPAAESAIRSLPKRTVDKEMLGAEGMAECSICMDAVDLGSEVTELPCKHWFHGDCIEMWLKQHNTCPHCRRPIDQG
ncbi:RING finger domain protein, putative [Talaromyces stipitatus ATCC 10500]|nr:RING finger domain protein, putative [Talaromyces stipitatus ATCC 10500]EED13184.1 RING finger domain protein, putative [Talaromyces stipitatus ATCC 10500]